MAVTELPLPAGIVTAFLIGPLPVIAVVQARLMARLSPEEWPSRPKMYASAIAGSWMLAIASLVSAATSGISYTLLGLKNVDTFAFVLWLAFALVGTAALMLAFKAFGVTETPLLRHLIPQTRGEKLTFVGVSITAGICEEIIFRGFLLATLRVATGSALAAVLISAVAFAIAHAHQSISGGIRAGLLGLVLTVPVILTGSLYPSIAAHIIVDVVAGLWLASWLLKS